MKGKIENPYRGLSEEERWDFYKKNNTQVDDLGFFLVKDFELPKAAHLLMLDAYISMPSFYRKSFSFYFDKEAKLEIARSTSEAFKKIKEGTKYDLIITATSIIGESPDSFVSQLRNLSYQGIILLHSSIPTSEGLKIVKKTAIDGFLLKPHGLFNLLKMMGDHALNEI